jgi:hypothetical protein
MTVSADLVAIRWQAVSSERRGPSPGLVVRTSPGFGYCCALPLHGEAGVTGRTAAADHGIAPGFGCLVFPARLRTMRGSGFVRRQN